MNKSFIDRFGGAPSSITQLGLLLKQISLEELSSTGFMIVVKEGDILIVPEGYLIIEACLGDVACDTITYNFLLESNVSSWKQEGVDFISIVQNRSLNKFKFKLNVSCSIMHIRL